ncbi:hypothetical protein [Aquimarina sp. 2201CG5-10]|uniref:hypothetical protein n=1 Tax=Aquimarina callyspongiae TaxID=3098150 RepID=UPI002AB40E45|nr:hypothetical protein [Aquimarina sp. 2201CG5-10]MDY8136974.1 hypothetical protein [Aquimarina sp. 2201CG5-10]
MKRREEFSFLKGTWNQLKKINNKVHQLIKGIHNDKPYAINYSNLRKRFTEEIENYKNHPELIDIDEFSMNYTFGYHYSNNIDNVFSKEAMYIEVKSYLKTIKVWC